MSGLGIWNARGRLNIITRFWSENLLEGDRLKTSAQISIGIWMEGIDWIYVPVVRDRWKAVVSRVMKLVHLNNCQLHKQNSAPWSYKKEPWEKRCTT